MPETTYPNRGLRSNLPGPESQQQIADDFFVPTSIDAAAVAWAGTYYSTDNLYTNSTAAFTIRFFSGGSAPVAPADYEFNVTASVVPTGVVDFFHWPYYRYSAKLPVPVHLNAGQHWISILESEPSTDTDFVWMESLNDFDDLHAVSHFEGNAWTSLPNRWDFAFSINEVPEPCTSLLFGVAILVTMTDRRTKGFWSF
jgi:hypothetical protein